MPRSYTAYLVRHWVLGDGRERVEVQALPSGEARRYGSLAEAYVGLQQGHNQQEAHDPPDLPPGEVGANLSGTQQ
jgi:hypothetical protein